ncbi:MAG TPA: VOC family protein [Mycobacteriales bacterium]|nr:VOC family protein [Mycobacteriales bacterium]
MRLDTIVIDCQDKHRLAEFWCALLGTTVRGEVAQYLGLHPVPEGNARLVFQQVPDLPDPVRRGRVHLDLDTHDLDGDTRRALELGATLEAEVEDLGTRWRTLRDPEGNLFCLVPA